MGFCVSTTWWRATCVRRRWPRSSPAATCATAAQAGAPFREVWAEPDSALGRVFRLPRVAAIIHSLVGPDPRYDHHAAHLTPAHTRKGANLHQDAEYDVRRHHFDLQISFFPEDTPAQSGGTLFLPGSQFRRVYESTTRRYQDVLGQVQAICDAGTMFFWHTNVWHAARSNHTDRDRYMFKLRLNPTVRQQRLWNTGDLEDPETRSDIGKILSERIPWHGQRHRIEVMNRIRLWRYLSGDPDFDVAFWWTPHREHPGDHLPHPARLRRLPQSMPCAGKGLRRLPSAATAADGATRAPAPCSAPSVRRPGTPGRSGRRHATRAAPRECRTRSAAPGRARASLPPASGCDSRSPPAARSSPA